MPTELSCYRCGASLAGLTLPISRHDECPSCSVTLRVCRMCQYFDPGVPKQCTEDDAEEVIEKERLTFCEWYRPSTAAFDPKQAANEVRARSKLATLFGEEEAGKPDADPQLRDAEDLFK